MSGVVGLRLVRLYAEGYGRLREFVLEPASRPGTVVIAPNEAGKSTVASAIFHGLFGFEDKAREDARRPWEGGAFRVTLEWMLGADTRCAITRDFDTQDVVVEWRRAGGALESRWAGNPNPRGRSSDREAYDAQLKRLLGFASRDLFRQTVFVGPGTPVQPLASELLRLLSGSERTDFRKALEDLEEGYYDLTRVSIRDPGRSAKQNPRRIEENAERRAELLRRVETARTVHTERRRAEDALAATQARLAAIEREALERGPVGAAIRRLAEIRREETNAEAALARLDAALERFSDWEAAVREREASLRPVVRYLHHGPDFSNGLTRLERLAEERDRMSREREPTGEAERTTPLGVPAFRTLSPAMWAIVGVLASALGVTAAALGVIVPWGGIAAAAAGLCLALFGVWRERSRRTVERDLAARQAEITSRIERLEAERRSLAEDLGLDPDGVDPAAERNNIERAREIGAQLDGMREVHDALGDRAAIEAERREIKELGLDVLRLERRQLLDAHPYFETGSDYSRRFLLEGERLEVERAALIDEELRHRRALAGLPPGLDDPRRLEMEIERLDGETGRLEIERDAFRLAYEMLRACSGDFVRVMVQRLQYRVGRIFKELTEGRYAEVVIDPMTLDLNVGGREKVDVSPSSLSRGTHDQLYFALRVAVLEVLSGDRALPLILDDPFLHFDGDRLAQAERALERVGETHQILVLSHDPRLAAWSFARSELPERAGKPIGAPSGD